MERETGELKAPGSSVRLKRLPALRPSPSPVGADGTGASAPSVTLSETPVNVGGLGDGARRDGVRGRFRAPEGGQDT